MIKETIKYLLDLNKKPVVEVNGESYSCDLDNRLNHISPPLEPCQKQIMIDSLSGIADYVKQNPDNLDVEKMILNILSYSRVNLESSIFGYHKQRESYIVSCFDYASFDFGQYFDMERFLIKLHTMFVETPDLIKLINIISSVKDNEITEQIDNGITQMVNVKKGVDMVSKEKLPRLVKLRPFCTYNEIEQPERVFLFRAVTRDECIKYALFCADGNKWESEVKQSIKEYFNREVKELKVIT